MTFSEGQKVIPANVHDSWSRESSAPGRATAFPAGNAPCEGLKGVEGVEKGFFEN